MDANILENFEKHVFYHGASLEAAESIAHEGFRSWFQHDEIGRYPAGGNLGNGLYITCNWRIALCFGTVLLRVSIRPGTRLLNSALRPDERVLAYLQREFGREILGTAPWKILPRNKKLALRELIALFRYHYWHTWERHYGERGKGLLRWTNRRDMHWRLLRDSRKMLVRYGYHGYGNPEDENGILVFAHDRLVLQELVAEIPHPYYTALHEQGFRSYRDLRELKEYSLRHSSDRARRLARRIAQGANRPAD